MVIWCLATHGSMNFACANKDLGHDLAADSPMQISLKWAGAEQKLILNSARFALGWLWVFISTLAQFQFIWMGLVQENFPLDLAFNSYGIEIICEESNFLW